MITSFSRPRHSDGTWEGIKGRNPFVVCREDFAGDGAPEEVVEDLNAALGAKSDPRDKRQPGTNADAPSTTSKRGE
jgi:hypothetical protein